MAELQKQSLCPRLIDYLAIVGARGTSVHRASGTNNNQPPVQVSKEVTFHIIKNAITFYIPKSSTSSRNFFNENFCPYIPAPS